MTIINRIGLCHPPLSLSITRAYAIHLPKEKILLDSDLYSPGGSPTHFKIYAKQLLDFITKTGLDVKIIAGTHGGFGPFTDLQKFVNQEIQMIPLSNQTLSDRAGSNIEGEDKFSAYISMLWPDQFGTWIDDDGGLYYDT